ncbi:MAG: carbon-nitrogen hydrolase family protein [Candidatus Lokiarchaeota archaeon]|nr:carbon-nitrogen hydrolase family protein [Candidatus Lokiarchaeota archaeon]
MVFLTKSIKLSLVQCEILRGQEETDRNITHLINSAVEENPDILMLPERWRMVPPKEHFYNAIEEERGHTYKLIQDLARKNNCYIISGGIWEMRNDSRYYITSYVFDNDGKELGRQDKLHLYSYEPQVFTPGDCLQIFNHKFSNTSFSVLICFDIAFFETPRMAVESGAELLFSPTLIKEEGMYNWNIYLQARVLENRVPIAACNPVGSIFGNLYKGKSKIISFKRGHTSPSVLNITEYEENIQGILTEQINLSYPNYLRKKRLNEKREKSTIQIKKN